MIEQQDAEIYLQVSDPSITHASIKEGRLTGDEQAKLALFLIAFLREREWEWFQYKDGIIDEIAYKAYHDVIPIHLGTLRSRKWWEKVGHSAFDPDFVKEVDKLLADAGLSDYLKTMRTWDD